MVAEISLWSVLLRKEGTMLGEPSAQDLLERYSQKPVRRFLQVDAHDANLLDESFLVPDGDGDCLVASISYDLRSSGEWLPVRVQIVPGADPQQVLRMLDKIRNWLRNDYEALVGRAETGSYWGLRSAEQEW
jgi:hypothetical protein